jgi:hypothetical protein
MGRADPDRSQLRQQGRLGRISKQGSHLVRWALIEAAQKTPTGGGVFAQTRSEQGDFDAARQLAQQLRKGH